MSTRIYILDKDEKVVGIIDNAYDIHIKMQLLTRTNGFETLNFNIPFRDANRSKLYNECVVEVNDRRYIVKKIDDEKSRKSFTKIECDATWYDLSDGDMISHLSNEQYTASMAIAEQLSGTGWTLGIVNVLTEHKFTIGQKQTRLYNLRYIQKIFGGDLWFDTKRKKVNLYDKMGVNTDIVLKYENNLSELRRTVDTRNIITRYTMTGSGGITIASVNDGKDYVENYSYYDSMGMQRKLKEYKSSDERFTNVQYMKWYMEEWLKQYCQPIVTYELKPASITLKPNLGDSVYVIDTELGVSSWIRVLEIDDNLSNSQNTVYVLDSLTKDVSDTLNEVNDSLSTDMVSEAGETYTQNMSPYNLLLNSRGDDDLSYWSSTGFEVDQYEGVSGFCSFKTTPGIGRKVMEQVVHPSTKDNYVVSAQVAIPQDYEYNEGDVLGIEVEIEYEDGTVQVEFMSVFGIINGEVESEVE